MTIDQYGSEIRDELARLMASRKDRPAQTIGHAMRILKLLHLLLREHDRALFVAQREIAIAHIVNERPANEC